MYEGKLVRLREKRKEDAESLARWFNVLETARLADGGAPFPQSPDEAMARVKAHAEGEFAVETLDGRLLGDCGCYDVSAQGRSCQVGWMIGDPEARGKGFGTDMILTLLRYLFRERNMERVMLTVFSYNAHGIRLYEKLGFVREGVLRENVFAMGRYHDEHAYSMLRREYEARYGGADV
jgi:RimJ/RimL family protein N-acetyltransferase